MLRLTGKDESYDCKCAELFTSWDLKSAEKNKHIFIPPYEATYSKIVRRLKN